LLTLLLVAPARVADIETIADAAASAFLDTLTNPLASWANDGMFLTLEMQIDLMATEREADEAEFWKIKQHLDTMDIHGQGSFGSGDR
jgi:hypothetical protein